MVSQRKKAPVTPREKLQALLDEAAETDNGIDGVAIIDTSQETIIQSRSPGHSGAIIKDDLFVTAIYREVIEILRQSLQLQAGSPQYLRLLLEKAIWTMFILNEQQGFTEEFLVVFYFSDEDGNTDQQVGLHSRSCLKFLFNKNGKPFESTKTPESIIELFSEML